ncbi:helix-turn-helix domain-containing protein [Coprothermobacter platensis]|uniref:helix-turn-helix domain-containing protein n=1 Tax=Coprothermobacter platensis TaxID=108819 RepID=UPI0009FC9561|nr:helix-turn-helix transcriptional regulator [Coprothermobacter platensis]
MMRLNSKTIKQKCLEKGWSLYRLALESGVDPTHLYRIMSGKRGAGASTIYKLSVALGCSPLEIIYNDDD